MLQQLAYFIMAEHLISRMWLEKVVMMMMMMPCVATSACAKAFRQIPNIGRA